MPIDKFGRQFWGPYLQKKEQRRIVCIRRDNGSIGSMSYARWLMENHLGRKLTKNEEVDHIDENKLNDIITNYQILEPLIHRAKSKKPEKMFEFICQCGKNSSKSLRHVKHNRKQNKSGPYCSRICAGKYGGR